MRVLAVFIQFILLSGIFLVSAGSVLAQDAELISHFDYDKTAPLGIREIGVERRGNVSIHELPI